MKITKVKVALLTKIKFMSRMFVIKPSDRLNYTCSGYQINGSGEEKKVSVFQPCMRVVWAFLTGGLHLLRYVQYVCVQRERAIGS